MLILRVCKSSQISRYLPVSKRDTLSFSRAAFMFIKSVRSVGELIVASFKPSAVRLYWSIAYLAAVN